LKHLSLKALFPLLLLFSFLSLITWLSFSPQRTLEKYQIEESGLNWNDFSDKLIKNGLAKNNEPHQIALAKNLFQNKEALSKVFGKNYSRFLPVLQKAQQTPPVWYSNRFMPPYIKDSGTANALSLRKPLKSFLKFLPFLFENYFFVIFFGSMLVKPFFSDTTFKYSLGTFLASFFIGYTSLLGIIRVYSLICPYEHIYWPVFITELLITIFLLNKYQLFQIQKRVLQANNVKEIILNNFLWGILLLVFVCTVLMLQVRQWNFAWVGHGTYQYAYLIEEWQNKPPLHFPFIEKHYDELIFHYFLSSPAQLFYDPILPWWVTLGLIKTSLLAFLFFAFRKLNISFFFSLLFSLFMFIGTSSLIPTKYYMLFDSANFLYFTAHSGRIVGIGIMLMLIVDAILERSSKNSLPLLTLILIGLGITATSISNALWLLVLYPILVITVIFFQNYRQENLTAGDDHLNNNIKLGTILCFLAVITLFLMYGLPFKSAITYHLRTLSVFLVIELFLWIYFSKLRFFFLNIKNSWDKHRNILLQAIVLLGAILFGIIFLGNMFVENPLRASAMKNLGKIVGETNIQLLPIFKWTGLEPHQTGTFAIGDHREMSDANEYCQGLHKFAAYYGWILILIILTNFLFNKGLKRKDFYTYTDFILYEIFLLSVVGLVSCFFFTDFIDFGSRAWLKTRFLEWPVYSIMFISFYFFNRVCSRYQKALGAAILIIYMIVPFLATEHPRQIKENTAAFWDVLKSGK